VPYPGEWVTVITLEPKNPANIKYYNVHKELSLTNTLFVWVEWARGR